MGIQILQCVLLQTMVSYYLIYVLIYQQLLWWYLNFIFLYSIQLFCCVVLFVYGCICLISVNDKRAQQYNTTPTMTFGMLLYIGLQFLFCIYSIKYGLTHICLYFIYCVIYDGQQRYVYINILNTNATFIDVKYNISHDCPFNFYYCCCSITRQ